MKCGLARRYLLAVVLAAISWSGCAARRPGEPIQPGFNLYSPEQDVEIGRQVAAQIRAQVDVVDNRELQLYVSSLGRRLSSPREAGGYPYNFTLINDRRINAFALPGGPVFVHSGLIQAAENESQLAGVLAHEIAHVALRHATHQASKATLVQIPAAIGGAVIGEATTLAQLAQLGLGFGFNSLLLKYSRDGEREADALGARLMSRAGYNPVEMARFFETLESRGGSRAPEFLSSHPNPGNRIRAVQAEVGTLSSRNYGADSGQFPRMKRLVAQLPPPRRSAQIK